MNQIICPICGNIQGNISFTARERLIGTREQFNYGECVSCRTVFLLDKIDDFSPYYPEGYHCFDDSNYPSRKKFLLKELYYYNFWNKGLIGSITNKIFTRIHGYRPEQNIVRVSKASKFILKYINKKNIQGLSILDLGCGSGSLLKQLQGVGFTNLTGVEPFGKPTQKGITFIQSNLNDYLEKSGNEKYDIVIMSHVLEHLYDHDMIIQGLKNILSERGMIIIAMPFTGKLFNKYREFTMSLDAPRHVIMHSIKSFRNIITGYGLQVNDESYEQKGWDIFASEMYSRDIGFSEIKSLGIKDYEKQKHHMIANIYNAQKEGGSHVTFFITHKN